MKYAKTNITKIYDEIKKDELTKEEGLELLRRYRINGDKEALDEIIRKNFHTFYHIVNKTSGATKASCKFDDYFQVAVLAYIKAINRFDLNTDFSLNTYCYECARRELMRHIKENEDIIRVTHHVHTDINKIKDAIDKFSEEFNRDPDIKELVKLTELTEYRVSLCIDAMKLKELSSMEQEATVGNSNKKITLGEVIPNETNIEEEVERKILIDDFFTVLNEREKKCIELKYYGGLPQVKIAEIVGVSQVQAGRILKKAIDKMKERIGDDMIEYRKQA